MVSDQLDNGLTMIYEQNKTELENGVKTRNKHVQCQFTFVKWIGLLALMVTGMVPGYVLLDRNPPISYAETSNLLSVNCQHIQQFPLENNVYVTVCSVDKHTVIDIRKFVNGNASITGIQLQVSQWRNLESLYKKINNFVPN